MAASMMRAAGPSLVLHMELWMITKYQGAGFEVSHEAETMKTAFQFVARCEEVFGAAQACQNCNTPSPRPRYRENQGNSYYSYQCRKCGWELKMGQSKDNKNLFPGKWEPPYNGGGGQSSAPSNSPPPKEDVPF